MPSFMRYKLKVAKWVGKISDQLTTDYYIYARSTSYIDVTLLGKLKLCEF